MTQQASFSTCYYCNRVFTPTSIPDSLVLTVCCYNIFHTQCLGDWVIKAKTCSNCRHPTFPQQLGKSFQVIWEVFKITLQNYPTEVVESFAKEEVNDDSCINCLDEFPMLSLSYLPTPQRLAHTYCAASTLDRRDLSIVDLGRLTKEMVGKHTELKKYFTPKRK